MDERVLETKAWWARVNGRAGNNRWKVATTAGNIITYSALSRREIGLLYHGAVAAGCILVLRRVVRFLTGLEVSIEGLSPERSVADMRQRLVKAKPPMIGYKYQFFCNDRALSDDDLLGGAVVYAATIVPSELQFSKLVEQKREPPTVDTPELNWLLQWFYSRTAGPWKCKVTVKPLPLDVVNEHGFLRADAAATLSDRCLENLECLAWLTSPDITWTSMDQMWWSHFRQDHYWCQTLNAGPTSDRNALNILFEGQAAHSASHAGSHWDTIIVSAGYVLTASKMRPSFLDDFWRMSRLEFDSLFRRFEDEHVRRLFDSTKNDAPVRSSDRPDGRKFMQRRLHCQRRQISPASAPKRRSKVSGAKLPRSKCQQSWGRRGRK